MKTSKLEKKDVYSELSVLPFWKGSDDLGFIKVVVTSSRKEMYQL